MRKGAIIFFILVCFATRPFAQGKLVDSLKDWINKHPKIDSQYIQTLHRISYQLSEKNVKTSYQYFLKVERLSDSLNFAYGKSLAQINLGILLSSSASFDASNNAFFKAVDYAETCGALRLKAISLNNIADNFLSLKNYDKCQEYALKAISVNKVLPAKYNPSRGIAINYELISRCFFCQKLYNEAKNNLEQGKPYLLTANESYIFSQYYLDFGKLKAIDKNFDSAKYYFKRAIKESKKENDVRNEFQAYLGEAQFITNLPVSVKISLLDSALNIAKSTQYYEGISNTAEQISIVYDQQGKTDSALSYFRLYRAGFDSLFSQNATLNVVINESQWVDRKKVIENEHLKQLSQLQKQQLIFKNILLLAVLILLGLVIVSAFFFNKSIQSQKKRSEFALKQKIAESQIQSLRAQMNPHFIFNSLNSIENFMMQNEKRKASDYLHKFALLIRTILESSRNEMTSVSHDMEALKLYVDLEQMRFHNKFSYKENIDPQLLSGDYSVPSLLIQPYVENAIVHGIGHSDKNDLRLTVTATLEESFIKYVIEDNGIGRTKSEDYNQLNKLHHRSFGLQITEDRLKLFNQEENLNGHIKIIDLYDDAAKPLGTRIEVKIKAI